MFTGIVEAVGRIVTASVNEGGLQIAIEAKNLFRGASVGDSIAVSGICLTAVRIGPSRFSADVSPETLAATTAGQWKIGTAVNLEKSLTPSKPLGGHLVSGHVDGFGKVVSIGRAGASRRMRFESPRALSRYIARKGFVRDG